MSRKLDLSGMVFGRLTVLRESSSRSGSSGNSRWECKCLCGALKTVDSQNLKNGRVLSCGCLQKERKENSQKMQRLRRKEMADLLLPNLVAETQDGQLRVEKWKDINNYKGFYQVSDFGRIKRLEITFWSRNKWNNKFLVRRTARIHKAHINDKGMPRVELSKRGIQKIFSVSRLVATAFVPNPKNLPNACHKDDDPQNNMSNNLFWGTTQDNVDDKCKKGRQARGVTGGRTYLKESEIIEMRNKFNKETYGPSKLAKEYNTTATNVSYIVKRRNWKHIP